MNDSFTNRSRTGHRSPEQLSKLLHLIYHAGMNPECWNTAVREIAASFGSSKALLFTPMLAPQHGGLIFPAGISEATLQLWGSNYIEHDIWTQQLRDRNLWRQGEAMLDIDMVPEQELLASKFYQEFLSGIGISRVCTGFVFANGPATKATLMSVFRDISDPPFNEDDLQWMRILVSHISRSLGVMQRLNVVKLQQASVLASFDRLLFGVVLLDCQMNVLHLNKSARHVIQRNDGLRLTSSRLLESSGGKVSSSSLDAWLTQMQHVAAVDQLHFLDGYQVVREKAGQYIVQCSAVTDTSGWEVDGTFVKYVAFIHDPSALKLPDAELLTTIYGLTKAQSRVALELAAGASYKDAAAKLHMSEETIRSHVKEIYPKTRVNKQADLVRLILSLGQQSV
jgi:DNA-binding CsgD family transcriptional regulator